MSTTDAVRGASEGIIRERLNEHTRKATRFQAMAVYVDAARPAPYAAEHVKIVERVMLEATVAEALYHQQQAKRFEDALVALSEAGK